jgi:hypothetical protein
MDEITNVSANETNVQETTPAKPTFDDLLKDPEYQAEFDRKAEGMKKKWEASWQKKAEKEKSEAEALAKMTEEEKHQHELQKLEAERKQAVAELNAYRLKDETAKIASEKGIDTSLLDLIDYSTATAESVKEKLEKIESVFSKAVEKAVNEKLKQPKPQEIRNPSASPDKAYLDEKYKNNPFYKQ